jgi:hypothetical protein
LLFERRMRGVLGGTISGAGTTAHSTVGDRQPDERVLGIVRSGGAGSRAAGFGGLSRAHRQGAGQAGCQQSQNPRELYQRLAEHIPTAADRAAFLKGAPPDETGEA